MRVKVALEDFLGNPNSTARTVIYLPFWFIIYVEELVSTFSIYSSSCVYSFMLFELGYWLISCCSIEYLVPLLPNCLDKSSALTSASSAYVVSEESVFLSAG